MGGQEQAHLELVATHLLGDWTWLLLVGFIALVFRSTIESLAASVMMFLGGDLGNDDIVLIGDRPARIVRKGIWKTTFFIYRFQEGRVIGGLKYVVFNDKLKDLEIYKPLANVDIQALLGHKEQIEQARSCLPDKKEDA